MIKYKVYKDIKQVVENESLNLHTTWNLWSHKLYGQSWDKKSYKLMVSMKTVDQFF